MMTSKEAKAAAVEAAGGLSAVAKAFQISPQAVWKWELVPPDRVLALESLCRGKVSRHEMRPDIFGLPPEKETA